MTAQRLEATTPLPPHTDWRAKYEQELKRCENWRITCMKAEASEGIFKSELEVMDRRLFYCYAAIAMEFVALVIAWIWIWGGR